MVPEATGATTERPTLISSPEFLRKRTDGTPGSFVEAVYGMVFGREPDPSGLAYWTGQASRLGPKRTAARLIASPESRRFRIRTLSDCVCVLGGPPETHIVTQGLIDWSAGGKVTSTGDFGTSDMDLAAPFGPVAGLSTRMHFTDLLNLETAPHQVATDPVAPAAAKVGGCDVKTLRARRPNSPPGTLIARRIALFRGRVRTVSGRC